MPPPVPPSVKLGRRPSEAVAAGLGRDPALHGERLLERVGDARLRRRQADAGHRVLELEPVLGLLDRLLVGADHLDAVLLQDAVLVQVERAVERGLAAHRRQTASGRSLAMIFSTTCQVIGSM
jgi:hypothetical protein